MAQEDRLKKQIDQLARVLARVLAKAMGAKSAQEITESIKEADKELEENYSFKLSLFNIDSMEFASLLDGIPCEQITTIADIYYEYALKCKNKQEQYPLFEKSLALYEKVNQLSKTYSVERQEKINEIKKQLS
ncbi:MAG TPA: hypothetical protein VK177_02175 [Flavobacteriales bacterium]|nr:hypothetical protein [Flavobacteriales bacterium]